ncbi:SCO family protein [Maribacter sp. IgM3_T14_3]|uniref:SCO family protein n=1 Tax=Maribacter sp. IgM3_T14_3 TaxID=3415140 RepID=UPI003C70238C
MDEPELPILSPKVAGVYLPIDSFQFTNQYADTISQEDVKGKVYVAEFFFSSCPSICPVVSKQLKRVFKTYEIESNFMILSHTIDPEHDTILKLKDYYENTLEIESVSNWHLLTGNRDAIYNLANFSYGAVVYNDDNKLKNNIMHSGALLLVDREGFVRGMYDGKDKESVDRLIADIRKLL